MSVNIKVHVLILTFCACLNCDDFDHVCNFRALIWLTDKAWLKFQFFHFSHSVMSDSLRPHGLERARLPYWSPNPRACSNSCPLHQWCHLSSHPLLSPSPAFKLSQYQVFFKWVSSAHQVTKVLEFPLGWTGWISLQSKGLSRVFSNTTASILWHSTFL